MFFSKLIVFIYGYIKEDFNTTEDWDIMWAHVGPFKKEEEKMYVAEEKMCKYQNSANKLPTFHSGNNDVVGACRVCTATNYAIAS